MAAIDYDPVAGVYDAYGAGTDDHDFFSSRVAPGTRVLELTSGTGRLSIPLAEAGAVLTCVDISRGMLDILVRKLDRLRLRATVLQADVQDLDFNGEFDVAILPCQSFMELVGERRQRNTLRSVHRALVPDGRFYCTMHNPAVRRESVDGVLRSLGTFRHEGGTVTVSGIETGGDPVVHRRQFIESYDEAGRRVRRIVQPMEFELIEEGTFRRMAIETGFEVTALFGDYRAGEFEARTSPVMIWQLARREPGDRAYKGGRPDP